MEKSIGKTLICPRCATTTYININTDWPKGKEVECFGRWGNFKCGYRFVKGRDF